MYIVIGGGFLGGYVIDELHNRTGETIVRRPVGRAQSRWEAERGESARNGFMMLDSVYTHEKHKEMPI